MHRSSADAATRGCESTVSNALAAIAHRLRSYLADETYSRAAGVLYWFRRSSSHQTQIPISEITLERRSR